MAKFLVTQEQYQQVMGANPSQFKGANLPVETVSWSDAMEFCKEVSEKTGQTVQLPTEAQWEFACRAGTTTTYYTGDTEADLGRAAWYGANSKGKTHPVGQKESNAFGPHDMHGNVWEWCEDVFHDSYEGAPTDGSSWVEGGNQALRVLRGGSWSGIPSYCRSADRYRDAPPYASGDFGCRVVLRDF
jgi:formylglycine-generating enzyme required for sulfatase activity